MDRQQELAELQRGWRPPSELTLSAPREVKLSGGGYVVAALAVALLGGAIASQIGLSRVAGRQAGERRALRDSGTVAEATVTRRWRSGGKDSTHRISYEFEHEGRRFRASIRAPRRIWERLEPGSAITVRFVPANPEISHPVDWDDDGMPYWIPPMTAAALLGIAFLLLWLIRRQIRLLSDGRPAPAIVVGRHSTKGGQIVKYEFPLLEGGAGKGRGQMRKPPEVGGTICILYDRDNPRRSAPYPFDMVRVVR